MDELTHLLLQSGAGDPDALAEFVTIAQPDVWRFCAAMLTADQADDATQETFVRAWRGAGSFRADSSARTWLLAIARRVCFELIRQRVRADHKLGRLAAVASSAPSGDYAETTALNDLVAQLQPDRRSAFVLTQLLGLSYDEAAAVLDCPIGTIRSRVARARGDLQALIEHPAVDRTGTERRSRGD